jgi:glycosyltransferase involved in cell wall biosynthesis
MPDGVSVVIPCYNAAKYLRETLDSVLAQDYQGLLEILVADDDSTDGSREIIESYGPPVQLLPKPSDSARSASAARNRCLRAATQPLVAFLDADDAWFPTHLSSLAEAMHERPDLALVIDDQYFMSQDGTALSPDSAEYPSQLTPDYLLLACQFGPGQVMVRRAIFDSVGLFDETLRHAEEYDMWLRIVEVAPAAYIPNDGCKYRLHPAQKSLKATLWEDAAVVMHNACKRYRYRWRSIRKRKAVLAYRFGQIALRQRRILNGLLFMAKAAMLDPARAVITIRNRSRQYSRTLRPQTMPLADAPNTDFAGHPAPCAGRSRPGQSPPHDSGTGEGNTQCSPSRFLD